MHGARPALAHTIVQNVCVGHGIRHRMYVHAWHMGHGNIRSPYDGVLTAPPSLVAKIGLDVSVRRLKFSSCVVVVVCPSLLACSIGHWFQVLRQPLLLFSVTCQVLRITRIGLLHVISVEIVYPRAPPLLAD